MHKNNTENKQTPNDVCALALIFYHSLGRAVFLSPFFALFPSLFYFCTIIFYPIPFLYYSMYRAYTACMALTHVFAFVVLCCVVCVFFYLSLLCVLILAVNYLLPRKLDAWWPGLIRSSSYIKAALNKRVVQLSVNVQFSHFE